MQNLIFFFSNTDKKSYWDELTDTQEAKDVFNSIKDWQSKFAEFATVRVFKV